MQNRRSSLARRTANHNCFDKVPRDAANAPAKTSALIQPPSCAIFSALLFRFGDGGRSSSVKSRFAQFPVWAEPRRSVCENTQGETLRILARTTAVLLFVVSLLAAARPSQAAACDRACLNKTVDNYLAALVAHDPSKVKFAPDVLFVENAVPMKPGDGLWKTASALPTTFKIYVSDPVSEEVGLMCIMQENDKPIDLVVRLKIRDGQIVEAEHVVARNLSERSLKNLDTPRPGLLATVPPSDRIPRAEMLTTGASYYQALVSADANDAPFADDCVRRENGMQTTSNPPPDKPGFGSLGALGCAAQLKTGTFNYIKRIEPRRVEIADPETGLVMGFSQFRHPMVEKTYKITGVPGVDHNDLNIKPFDMVAVHIFKVSGGKIHEIEAMGFTLPYDSKTGWAKYDDQTSAKP